MRFAPVPTRPGHWGVGRETIEYSKTPLARFAGEQQIEWEFAQQNFRGS